MNSELNWLNGKSLASVEKKDFSWFFTFAQSGSIAIETFWRLLNSERLVVASGDHDQLFGLKEPVDAANLVVAVIGAKKIVDYSCSEVCSDLIISFEDNVQIQFLNTSGGYESWRAGNDGVSIICMGGGGLSIFKKK